jgi:hypothetical protein
VLVLAPVLALLTSLLLCEAELLLSAPPLAGWEVAAVLVPDPGVLLQAASIAASEPMTTSLMIGFLSRCLYSIRYSSRED